MKNEIFMNFYSFLSLEEKRAYDDAIFSSDSYSARQDISKNSRVSTPAQYTFFCGPV